ILNLADTEEDPVNVFSKAVEARMPDVIGFSVMNPNRWNAIDCAKAAKKINPDIVIVFGGPAPTFLFKHLFSACPEIDFIIKGEGETGFLELLNRLETGTRDSFEEIPSLVQKKDGTIVETSLGTPIEDLDTLVHPSKYFKFQHLAMSRGCPGYCTFCGSPKFWGNRKVRFHSAEWFAHEMEALAKKGVTHFYISDDTFTMDKPRVLEFCRLITEKGMNVTWNAISRVDYVDADILLAMRTAGCIQISYGVESGSEKIRKTLGKPIDREKIIAAFSMTRACGILARAYFIYGSPGETKDTIQESIDLIRIIRPLSAIFYMLVIFPGTFLYQSAKEKKLVSDDFWHQRIEDVPWFEIDNTLDFKKVKAFGDALRTAFYNNLDLFSQNLDLVDKKELYAFHADFLSRLAMTFSHGEYAADPRVKNQSDTAARLFEQALSYAPDTRAFLGLAMQKQKIRDFDGAMAILEKAMIDFPAHKDLNLCMGICLMNKGRFKTALTFFKPFKDFPDIRHYIQICQKKS
ncbi:MAG: B12-binding domain-containing radical SAM protein, partial [Desulfobacula sp. GWF2_41_7]